MTQPADTPALCAVAIGNSRVRAGRFASGSLVASAVSDDDTDDAIRRLVADHIDTDTGVIAIASVAPARAQRVESIAAGITGATPAGATIVRLGRDLPIPIAMALENTQTVGHDRLLAALGAFTKAGQACVVVDAGTAVTIDFVDGEGTFQGGAIAPGPAMMLDALHNRAEQLPRVEFTPPDPERGVFGKDTPHAMLLGVTAALRGLFRERLDTYAEIYGAYPQVIATGGNAALLEPTGLVDHLVPDLELMGLHAAFEAALRAEHDSPDPTDADQHP